MELSNPGNRTVPFCSVERSRRRLQRVPPLLPDPAETGNRDRTFHQLRPRRELGQFSDPVGQGSGAERRRGAKEIRPAAVREPRVGRPDSEHDLPWTQAEVEG